MFALRVLEGTPIHARPEFEPHEGGARMGFRAHGQLAGPTRLAEPLLGRTLRRQLQDQPSGFAEDGEEDGGHGASR